MTFCTACGAELGQSRFCTNCGQPAPVPAVPEDPAGPPRAPDPASQSLQPGADDPDTTVQGYPAYSFPAAGDTLSSSAPSAEYWTAPSGPARSAGGVRRVVLALAALLLVTVAAAGVTWWFTRTDKGSSAAAGSPAPQTGRTSPPASATTPSAPATTSTPPSTTAVPPVTTPAPSTALAPGTPAEQPLTPRSALRLTSSEATQVLDSEVRRDRTQVAALGGWWVPQVSSKCAGLDVDLGPHFRPDGVVDTYGVTEQQILALHTALAQRYSAITTTAADLGVKSQLPSACTSQTLWVSLVPQRFGTGTGALRWCDRESIPLGECGARLVMPPGVPGTRLLLRPGA